MTQPTLTDGNLRLTPQGEAAGSDRVIVFDIWHDDDRVGAVTVTVSASTDTLPEGSASWMIAPPHRRMGFATRAVRMLVDWALTEREQGGLGLTRIEARVEQSHTRSLRIATRAGLRREGIRRVAAGHGAAGHGAAGHGAPSHETAYVVHARLASDPPLSEPESFRALLNSFLPRKRAIGQLLVRDQLGRVLLCQLTYKRDWDLPGGVVEVGESPREAVGREIEEELALSIAPGRLLLTDWLPPWGGWDDALCLVFDGGIHDAAILDGIVMEPREIKGAHWCTLEQVVEHCADFTARRIAAALANLDSADSNRAAPIYTESGRPQNSADARP